MNGPPAYFEPIRHKAARRWDQLEQDPELAGPWHQLFKQVQSPGHVLSELLQNADDAGATEASVRIEGQTFVFEHNGEDFSEEHFASLCRFGYSNKRALHTIGFRGIGFKSTFSLGDCVELHTPTLTVSFDRRRFTEPHWLPSQTATNGKTFVRVAMSDRRRQTEVERNLEEWAKSAVSLLFFRHIRRLQIGELSVQWVSLGSGPVKKSEWIALNEQRGEAFLLIQSDAEAFPEEALNEIKQERLLGLEEDTDLPPCTIEIVLGAQGRLFVVLPTGVETTLPFACNAPFIQDPARLKIKDPETSPTNRWLLERAGRLAASAMSLWLGQSDMLARDRAVAYGLFPDVDQDERVCGTMVRVAFLDAIRDQAILLTDDGELTVENASVIIPSEVLDIWSAGQAAALLDDKGRPALCRHVQTADRRKLLRWHVVEEIDKRTLIVSLCDRHPPTPESWHQLMNLWAYLAPEITDYRHVVVASGLCIVPVQGKDILHAATDLTRLGEKKLLQSEGDWGFLSKHLIVLNQNWLRFLAEQRRTASEQHDALLEEAVNAAYAVLEKVGLDDTSDVDDVIAKVASKFFCQQSIDLSECVRLAQISAKLGVTVAPAFQFVTRDRTWHSADENVLFDEDGKLEQLVPTNEREANLLHTDYVAAFGSCSREEWFRWISSGRSGLQTMLPLSQASKFIWNRPELEQEARRRGHSGYLFYPYRSNQFVVEDWDFDEAYWLHWKTLAAEDDHVWTRVVDCILSQRDSFWNRASRADLLQIASSRNKSSLTGGQQLVPTWALRLRELPCLRDTRGVRRTPGELLRRTPETESLLDVEPFVDGHVDTEAKRPLLDLLGVRSTPTGPDRLLECLRALARAAKPPDHEVDKLHRRLDQMVNTCSTSDLQNIKQAFRTEKLILTEDEAWANATAVFLSSNEEDAPGAAVIRPAVNDLTLWRKIGIAERPTADLAIKWLKELPSGQILSPEDARRVRSLLARYPDRIWQECAHWLNLAGEWAPVSALSYALTMQPLIQWKHLHQWVKQTTADLQRLPVDATSRPPFSELPMLARRLEDRFHLNPLPIGQAEQKEWLTTLGTELRRVEMETEEETQRVRGVAETLARSSWQNAPGLETIPYIDGQPAGTPRQADVLWLDQTLYVDHLPMAKLAKRVPEEINKVFARGDIKAALDYSFERPPKDVREYLKENFDLAPLSDVSISGTDGAGAGLTKDRVSPSSEPDVQTRGQVSVPNPLGSETANVIVATQGDQDTLSEQPGKVEQDIPVGDEPKVRPSRVPKPPKPSIVERFALAHGFRKHDDDRFVHVDGSWVGRANGAPFPWERRTASGDLVRSYWAKDHCLEAEPLELGAEVWWLIEKHPETHALIVVDRDGNPVEMTGVQLRQLQERRILILHPATYRLEQSSVDRV